MKSRKLRHNVKALRKQAQCCGLQFNQDQEAQIGLLKDAISDRYSQTGTKKLLELNALHNLCVYLNEVCGAAVYKDEAVRRALPQLL
jgi:hypothetical protein